jgi:hypothetical protein
VTEIAAEGTSYYTARLLSSRCASRGPGAIRELGPDELAMLKQSNVSDTIKMLNLRKLLNITVEEWVKYEPHVIPIGERAEAVAKAYEERHIATQQALESYEKLAEQYVHAHPRQSASCPFSDDAHPMGHDHPLRLVDARSHALDHAQRPGKVRDCA